MVFSTLTKVSLSLKKLNYGGKKSLHYFGWTPKQVEKAFAKALTVSHGLATDIGLLENNHRLRFEMSHTVAEAKRILTGVEPENMYYTNKKC